MERRMEGRNEDEENGTRGKMEDEREREVRRKKIRIKGY